MLISGEKAQLLIVDVQESLTPVMEEPRKVIHGCVTLAVAARRLGMPVVVSEQYPRGLGPTMVDLRGVIPEGSVVEKTAFSCAGEPAVLDRLRGNDRRQVILAGIEAHVCVLQSAIGLREEGFEVFVVKDACSSRRAESERAAHDRLSSVGIPLVTIEMALFECLGGKNHPAFKDIQRLVK
ncbi:MAG: hydrolase [Alphaproteobacteria bacterium]|nr:hydrolase [Alphaproteobacteria bacterium]